jgi:hypothetical protein
MMKFLNILLLLLLAGSIVVDNLFYHLQGN